MNTVPMSRRRTLQWLGLALATPTVAAELPGDSVYQLRVPLTDQQGRPFDWASLRGQPVLASMFYSSCDMVCPMIFETLHLTLKALPARERDQVKLLIISFDPTRDTVPVLQRTAQAHACDERWTLARSDEANTRKIAAALGVQYRRLANGEFNHSSTLLLLDPQGRIAARSGLLGKVDAALLKALHRV